jgi:hypothetical protein
MHPRSLIKTGLKTLLEATPGLPPVYLSRVRDLRKGEHEAVIIYGARETLQPVARDSESAPGYPVRREMTFEIIAVVAAAGDGEEASLRADEICRSIEIAISRDATDLRPVAQEQGFLESEIMRCVTTLTYTCTHIDGMEA